MKNKTPKNIRNPRPQTSITPRPGGNRASRYTPSTVRRGAQPTNPPSRPPRIHQQSYLLTLHVTHPHLSSPAHNAKPHQSTRSSSPVIYAPNNPSLQPGLPRTSVTSSRTRRRSRVIVNDERRRNKKKRAELSVL